MEKSTRPIGFFILILPSLLYLTSIWLREYVVQNGEFPLIHSVTLFAATMTVICVLCLAMTFSLQSKFTILPRILAVIFLVATLIKFALFSNTPSVIQVDIVGIATLAGVLVALVFLQLNTFKWIARQAFASSLVFFTFAFVNSF